MKKTAIPYYRLDEAAQKLTELGFKTSVIDLIGASAAKEFPIKVALPGEFHIWRKNDHPFAGTPSFPKGFKFLIVPPETLAMLCGQRKVELKEAYNVFEDPTGLVVDKYTAVPQYIDGSKPYVEITREDLFIEAWVLERVARQLMDERQEPVPPKDRKKRETTVLRELIRDEIWKKWPKDKPKPDPVSLVKEAVRLRFVDEFDLDDKGEEITLRSGDTLALKTIQNWISSDFK